MRYTPLLVLLAAVGLAAPVRAEVVVDTPWVMVRVGRPEVIVNTPWVTVRVGRPLPPPDLVPNLLPGEPPPVPMPPPEPLGPPLPGPTVITPVPVPTPVVSAGVRPPTLAEFAASFQPAPGRYEVVLLNPVTCCPTKVCFTLPCDRPCKVRVHSKSLEFSYGLFNKVEIRFKHDGEVTVRD